MRKNRRSRQKKEEPMLVQQPTITECRKMISSRDKWLIALFAGLLFVILSSPMLYKLLDKLTSKFGLSLYEGEGVTTKGLLLHGIFFVIVVRLLMK